MEFARLPVLAVAGAMFYNEVFDWWVLLGGAVIIGGNLINIRAEKRKKRS
jgi:drug/metabolite transporter (DMT)-like permease